MKTVALIRIKLAGYALAVKAVIFDLDGTLTYFNIDYLAARNEIVGFLTKQGFPRSLFSIKESAFDMLKKVKEHMENEGKEEEEFVDIRKK